MTYLSCQLHDNVSQRQLSVCVCVCVVRVIHVVHVHYKLMN